MDTISDAGTHPAFSSTAAPAVERPSRPPLLRWTYGLVNRIIMAGDVVVILLSSFALLAAQSGGVRTMSPVQVLLLAFIEAAMFLLVLNRLRRYRFEGYERLSVSIPGLLPGLICAWAIGALYFAAFRPGGARLSDLMLYWHLPQLAGLLVARLGAWALAQAVRRQGLVRRTVVFDRRQPGRRSHPGATAITGQSLPI